MRAWSHTMADVDGNSWEVNQSILVTSYGDLPHPVVRCITRNWPTLSSLRLGWVRDPVLFGLTEQAWVPQFVLSFITTSSLCLHSLMKWQKALEWWGKIIHLMSHSSEQKDFIKLPQGTSEVLTQGHKLLVRWKDNNNVTVATNMEEKYRETCD